MNKKSASFFLLAFFCLGLGFAKSAQAVVFTDIIPFNTTISYGSSQTSGTSWIHDINDNLGGNLLANITILDAALTISHDDTGASELWTVTGLGTLTSDNNPNSTVFNFGAIPLADLQADGLFTVALTESTSGADNFILFSSTLSGNYRINVVPDPDPDPDPNPNPAPETPEPVTASLIGLGLGLSALSRRFRNK